MRIESRIASTQIMMEMVSFSTCRFQEQGKKQRITLERPAGTERRVISQIIIIERLSFSTL